MQAKTKIIIIAVIVVVILGIGAVFVFNEFQSNVEKTSEKEEVKQQEEEKKEKQKPKLELTQDEVTLEVGAEFMYEDFIKVAENEDGYNLKDRVEVDDTISTEVPGKYKIEYVLDLGNGSEIRKEMILEVIEFEKSDNPD
jgi:flagellar biosynthesis component FlhA